MTEVIFATFERCRFDQCRSMDDKVMIEIFDSLAAVGDPVKEEHRVLHLVSNKSTRLL